VFAMCFRMAKRGLLDAEDVDAIFAFMDDDDIPDFVRETLSKRKGEIGEAIRASASSGPRPIGKWPE